MIIIGVDFHSEFQQIAFVESESGEFEERRLAHRDDAERFYRALAIRLLLPYPLASSLRGVADPHLKLQHGQRVCSLVPRMVFNDRPTYKERHARNSSWPES
jgi:hypothetical protein